MLIKQKNYLVVVIKDSKDLKNYFEKFMEKNKKKIDENNELKYVYFLDFQKLYNNNYSEMWVGCVNLKESNYISIKKF
jgi:hypothetical protein